MVGCTAERHGENSGWIIGVDKYASGRGLLVGCWITYEVGRRAEVSWLVSY